MRSVTHPAVSAAVEAAFTAAVVQAIASLSPRTLSVRLGRDSSLVNDPSSRWARLVS